MGTPPRPKEDPSPSFGRPSDDKLILTLVAGIARIDPDVNSGTGLKESFASPKQKE
jgi:hypothetical protein